MRASQKGFVPRMRSSSRGAIEQSILSASSGVVRVQRNSPVVMSRKAMPTQGFPTWMAARKTRSRSSSGIVEVLTPGVTSSVMPRFTSFLVSLGSSSCSQMATRRPALTSFGRYVSRAWWGNPASSIDAALPLARRVSVMPRISLAVMASSQKVS